MTGKHERWEVTHAALQERVESVEHLEKLLGDSADERAGWEAALGKLAALERENVEHPPFADAHR